MLLCVIITAKLKWSEKALKRKEAKDIISERKKILYFDLSFPVSASLKSKMTRKHFFHGILDNEKSLYKAKFILKKNKRRHYIFINAAACQRLMEKRSNAKK